MEQYSHRFCLRIDSATKQNNEKAKEVFRFVKDLNEKVPDFEIPEAAIGRAHSIGHDYTDKKHRKSVSLLLFAWRPSVIVQHFTELEGV